MIAGAKRAGRRLLAGALLLGSMHGAEAIAAAPAPPESLFVWGRFASADSGFAAILRSRPADTLALVRRGMYALWSNRLPEARGFFERAGRAGAAPRRLAALTAESYSRENDFTRAAVSLREAGRDSAAMALESFAEKTPYSIAGPAKGSLPFVQTDPLPVVELSVNGIGPFYFLIDTGGAELLLDPEFADSVGMKRFGTDVGTFGGGKRASYVRGTVDSVRLGPFVVSNVPTVSLDTRRMSMAAGGRRVAGILGTLLLSRFRFSLDYPLARLELARREAAEPAAKDAFEVPFWMAGDHYILARGRLDAGPEVTWFVDTGLAGAAFTAPASALEEAGIAMPEGPGFQGQGGGGAVSVKAFAVKALSLGAVRGEQYMGFYGVFPPSLERGLGTRVAGIISHGFFRMYRVTFDFDRMRMILVKT